VIASEQMLCPFTHYLYSNIPGLVLQLLLCNAV